LSCNAFTQAYRRCSKRIDHFFFHPVARSQMKLLSRFIVLVNHSAIRSGKLDGVSNDSRKNRFEIQSGADRLADFA
jgi:hypothetical protein